MCPFESQRVSAILSRAFSESSHRQRLSCLPWRPSRLLLWACWQGEVSGQPREGGQRQYCRSVSTAWVCPIEGDITPHIISGLTISGSVCSVTQCVASWWWLLWPRHISHPRYCTGKSPAHIVDLPPRSNEALLNKGALLLIMSSLRCSGVWIRSWLRGSTFPLSTGWSATANTLALWTSIMTSTSPSLCPCVPKPRRSCRRRRTWLRSCSSLER